MTTLLVVWFLAIACPALAFEDPDNFRGIKWGASPEEARNAIVEGWRARGLFRKVVSDLSGTGRLREFWFVDTVGDEVRTVTFRIYFLDEKFVHANVEFKSSMFTTMERIFKERYGAATSEETKAVQNRAGATFDNKTLDWVGKEITIRLHKYLGTVTDGLASVGRPIYYEYLVEERKLKAKSAAKDF